MGRDKALLRWGSGQLLDHAIGKLQRVARVEEILIVGDRSPYHGRGPRVVSDDFPDSGPLGGIATALRHARHESVLIVAVDMPCVSVDLLGAMATYEFQGDALVPIIGQFQPLHAIYRRSCLPAIERQIAAGALRISRVFDHLYVNFLDDEWVGRFDPDGRSFANVNTPDDIARLEREDGCVEEAL